jgi:hypothetical protein
MIDGTLLYRKKEFVALDAGAIAQDAGLQLRRLLERIDK